MFGKDKKQLEIGKVQEVVGGVRLSGARNLTVRQNGGLFEIHGEADDIAAKQQAFKQITDKLGDASGVVNFIAVSSSRSGPPRAAGIEFPPLADSSSSGGGRTHEVKKGETLSHIAQQYYGKASLYPKIFEANRDRLDDPDRIQAGMTLRIPEI